MATRNKDRKLKMKIKEEDSKENGLKLHKTNCDSLYRWSMWRMYLNEELSRVISARQHHMDYSNSVSNVTSPYLRHPDAKKHGFQMKKVFRRNVRNPRSLDILPDNLYLVYGLPRISIAKRVPDDVQKLHDSVHELEILHNKRERQSDNSAEDDDHISKLFDFMSTDETNNEKNSTVLPEGHARQLEVQNASSVKPISDISNEFETSSNNNTNTTGKGNINLTTKSVKHFPPVSKSRIFWERLANRKSEIIGIGPELSAKDNNENNGISISEEIIQKQHKLLKKPIPKRTSKDLWRTLRERKTEILQLREMSEQKDQQGNHLPNQVRRRESKTSQLWGFIFHKKKELVHMKRGHKIPHDAYMSSNDNGRSKEHCIMSNDCKSNISPRNFEDTFQRELAEKLKKRRDLLQSTSESLE